MYSCLRRKYKELNITYVFYDKNNGYDRSDLLVWLQKT